MLFVSLVNIAIMTTVPWECHSSVFLAKNKHRVDNSLVNMELS